MRRITQAVTLIELLTAITLLSIVVLALSNIHVFSHFHVVSSERRVKVQNEASLALEHMTKYISAAIGNTVIDGQEPLKFDRISGDEAIRFNVGLGNWSGYRYTGHTGGGGNRYQIWYYPVCSTPGLGLGCGEGNNYEVISQKIASFTTIPHDDYVDNYVTVQITACWDPATADLPNGTTDNPCVNMKTCIKMPSVSTN